MNLLTGLLADSLFDMGDLHEFLTTVIYSGMGMLIFAGFICLVVKILPFSVMKEIEQDQNVALAILMGSALIGLSIIIASALHG